MNSQSLARKAKSSRHLGVLHDVPSQQSDGILPPRALVHLVIERAALSASDMAQPSPRTGSEQHGPVRV